MTLNLRALTNDKYFPLLENHDRYLLLYGGAGSGKSHFVAQKLLVRIIMSMKRGYKERFLVLRVYALGQWGILQNIIFTNWAVEQISTEDKHYSGVLNGLDFGFNHPSALVRVGVKDDELYIFDEIYERGLTNNELIQLVKSTVPSD